MTDGSAGCDKLIWSSSTHPICVSVSEETERPYSGSPMSLLRTRPRRVWFMWRPGTAHTCCPTARWSPSHGTRRSKQIICVFFTPSPSGRWILNCFLWCLCPEATCAQTRWCAWSTRASARGRGPSKSKPGPFYAACATCQVMNCSQKHCEIRFLHALFLFCVRDLPQMSMMVKEKCPWGQSGCGSLSQQSLSRVRERPNTFLNATLRFQNYKLNLLWTEQYLEKKHVLTVTTQWRPHKQQWYFCQKLKIFQAFLCFFLTLFCLYKILHKLETR